MLSGFVFQNFKINYETLKLLNLRESRLEKIDIQKGDIKTLNADLFPASVKDLSLREWGSSNCRTRLKIWKIYKSYH